MRVAWLVLLSACSVYRGNGQSDSVTVDLTGVVDVENQTSLPLVVEGGTDGDETAEITCDSNLLDLIEAEVSGERFVVRVDPHVSLSPQTTCRVDATIALLESLDGSGSGPTTGTGDLTGFSSAHVSGSGPLDLDGVVGADVTLRSSGSGAMTAAGTADRLDVNHSGSGSVDARDLVATDVVLSSSGSGATTVTATRDIEVHLSGSGAVEVYGDPAGTVVVDDTGSGTVSFR